MWEFLNKLTIKYIVHLFVICSKYFNHNFTQRHRRNNSAILTSWEQETFSFALHNLLTRLAYLVAAAVAAISHTLIHDALCHHHDRLMLCMPQAILQKLRQQDMFWGLYNEI